MGRQNMALGRLGDGFIHQQDWDSVTNRIYAATHGTLQALSLSLESKRFFAHRADQDIEQILGNHGGDFTLFAHANKRKG